MSRADWSFLEHLLEEGQEYSTGIGRIWLTVLFLFRMLVLGTAAESAWDDEQADFVCNTKQPGCTAVCYDKAFPISHFRYFVLQVIFVSTPTIFYFGYVAIRAGRDKKKEEDKDEKQAEQGGGGSKRGEIVIERDNNSVTKDNAEENEKQDSGGKGRKVDKASPEAPKLKGRLLCAYAFSILLKVLLEVGFIIGLWVLYNGFFIAARFECTGFPCPHTVDCFVSRPTEKTIFTIYTQVIAAVSLLLNLVELLHLLQLAISHRLEKRYRAQHQDNLPRSEPVTARQETAELQNKASQSFKAGSHVNPHIQGEAACYPNPCESYGDLAIEVNWGPGEAEGDLLPSYVNCMGAMRTTHSPRVHYKKQAHHTGKTTKAAQKGHSKQKHYV
ncbi:gap junction protein alpha 4 [Enoplosus armatus]|uniref:gap junction protein alpha 4 n=1 Tax=Enoplosus armatus TaxID=215367 RepID=UPI0039913159